jgi:hypothetical protein
VLKIFTFLGISTAQGPGVVTRSRSRGRSLADRSGLAAHDAIVAGALDRNQRLLEQLDPADVAMLLGHIERLTRKAEAMLAVEKELG